MRWTGWLVGEFAGSGAATLTAGTVVPRGIDEWVVKNLWGVSGVSGATWAVLK